MTPFGVNLTLTRGFGDSEESFGALVVIFLQNNATLKEDSYELLLPNLKPSRIRGSIPGEYKSPYGHGSSFTNSPLW